MRTTLRLQYNTDLTRLRDAVGKYADEQLGQATQQLHDYDSPKGLLEHVASLYELRDSLAKDLDKESTHGVPTGIGSCEVDPMLVLEVITEGPVLWSSHPTPGWDDVLFRLVVSLCKGK